VKIVQQNVLNVLIIRIDLQILIVYVIMAFMIVDQLILFVRVSFNLICIIYNNYSSVWHKRTAFPKIINFFFFLNYDVNYKKRKNE